MRRYDIEQLSMEWFDLRIGKITGSNFDRISKSKWMDLIDEIVAEQLTGFSDQNILFSNDDMDRGKELEPIAIQKYSELKKVEVEKCGFIQCDQFDFFGCSPDAITKDGKGIIEIKSPKIKNHIRNIRLNKIPSEHFSQVISYFIADSEIDYVDFVSFCPDLEIKPIWIKRIERNEASESINEYVECLQKCSWAIDKLKNDLKF